MTNITVNNKVNQLKSPTTDNSFRVDRNDTKFMRSNN